MKKIFVVATLVLLFVGGLSLWAAFSVVKGGYAYLKQTIDSPVVAEQLESVKSEIKSVRFQPISCLNKTQSLMSFQPWLEKPAVDVLQSLKTACFNHSNSEKCKDADCIENKI